MEAFTEIQGNDVSRLPITDEHGKFVGLISQTDLVTTLKIIRESGEQSHPSAETVFNGVKSRNIDN